MSLRTNRMKICSVKKCYNVGGVTYHRFPNPQKDPARFQEWLRRIQNEELFVIDPMKLYNRHTVCRLHFRPADIDTNNRLHKTALPSLRIPFDSNDSIIDESSTQKYETENDTKFPVNTPECSSEIKEEEVDGSIDIKTEPLDATGEFHCSYDDIKIESNQFDYDFDVKSEPDDDLKIKPKQNFNNEIKLEADVKVEQNDGESENQAECEIHAQTKPVNVNYSTVFNEAQKTFLKGKKQTLSKLQANLNLTGKTREKAYRCRKCGFASFLESTLRSHVENHIKSDDPESNSPVKDVLDNLMSVATEVQRKKKCSLFKCGFCHYRGKTVNHLKVHMVNKHFVE